jgi:drug/metabolite transporter (DMT)-like permease
MSKALTRSQANLVLIIAACAWGCAFVPQSIVAPFIGPITFTGVRFLLGALVIAPLVWREWTSLQTHQANEHHPAPKITFKDWLHIAFMGALLCAGTVLQQVGMKYTSVTNAGFLTGLYVPLVPILGIILYRRRVHWVVWPAALACVLGTWLLTGAGKIDLNVGDLWVLATVLPFTLHVLWIGGLAERLHAPLLVAWGQFIACGVLAMCFALPMETFDWNNLPHVIWPLAYMVFISVGIGFTGQVIGQRYARPAEAAIILSGETVFAALAGAVILGERLPMLGYVGGALILAGIIIVQILPDPNHASNHAPKPVEPFQL